MPKPGSPEATYACAVRLKRLVTLAEEDKLSKEELIRNLNYSVTVLESAFAEETKRLANEDEELPEVNEDMVPEEVRDWLTLTFTRRLNSAQNALGKPPTFRSVANAIRAGIVVDRIFRRQSVANLIEIPHSLQQVLKEQLDRWSFDVMELNALSENHSLKFVGIELLHRYDLIRKFKIPPKVLETFLMALEDGYSKHGNPYHNLVHAADVTQTCHCIISKTKLVNVLNDLEIFAILFSALIHDYEHTGTTNNFHVKTESELALVYNDKGVLENFHVSSVYRLMKDNVNVNVLCNLTKDEFAEFRSMVVKMVLNTDMSLHFQQLNSVKSLLTVPENIDKSQALSLVLHCADISHPTKPFALHEKWTELLLQEFFRQGDMEKERELPFSPLCDRNNTLVAQSQIGFINFIVEPSFQVMTDLLQKIMGPLFRPAGGQKDELQDSEKPKIVFPVPWFDCLNDNKGCWEERSKTEVKPGDRKEE